MAQSECVFVASGEMQAQQVRAFLEAAGVPTMERGEALRNTHGLTLDGLGAVEILVAAGDADQARALLSTAETGAFRLAEGAEPPAAEADAAAPQVSKPEDSRD
jgi:Putative prokaryotic signal transducing protein